MGLEDRPTYDVSKFAKMAVSIETSSINDQLLNMVSDALLDAHCDFGCQLLKISGLTQGSPG